jgi:cell division septation protein DedD
MIQKENENRQNKQVEVASEEPNKRQKKQEAKEKKAEVANVKKSPTKSPIAHPKAKKESAYAAVAGQLAHTSQD